MHVPPSKHARMDACMPCDGPSTARCTIGFEGGHLAAHHIRCLESVLGANGRFSNEAELNGLVVAGEDAEGNG